jgi:hypothetical protein
MIVKQLQKILQRQPDKQDSSDLKAPATPSSRTGDRIRKNQIRLNWSSHRTSQIDWLSLYKAIDTAG